jgi:hypothetical protein
MAASRVRQHTRRTAAGETTTVHQYTRTGRGRRRGLISPRHAWQLLRRAFRAASRHKRGTAVLLGGLAACELAAWVTVRGAGFILATAGVLALGAGSLMLAGTGGGPG